MSNYFKKNILLCLITTLAIDAFAVTPSVTFGSQDSITASYKQGQFYVDITLTQPIGNLKLYGNYRNEMNKSSLSTFFFAPVQDYFTIGASYAFPFATIRLEHMCMHPVVSSNQWDGLQGGYTRLEITLGD